MTKEDFLALGLEEDLAVLCEAKSLEELGNYISREEFEKLESEKEEILASVKMKEDEHLQNVKLIKMGYEVDNAIKKVNGRNLKAVRALLDLDSIALGEDGSLQGLNSQLESLMKNEESSFLFKRDKVQSSFKGVTPKESFRENRGKVDFNNMTYSEQVKFLEENGEY